MSRFDSPAERLSAARALLAETPAAATADPDALAAFLAFRAHFRAFSLRYTLLLYAQRPRARYCMGFRQWLAYGRQVRRGERGLLILVPRFARKDAAPAGTPRPEGEPEPAGFMAGYVFDFEQTEASAGREADALRYCSPLPVLTGDARAALYGRLTVAANAEGWRVVEEEALTVDGYCDRVVRRLVVRSTLPTDAKCAVLAHEFAHGLAHTGPDARTKPHGVKELEAEGAAFLACAALGLDTSAMSLPYLHGYTDEAAGRTPSTYLAAADAIAARIVAAVERAEAPLAPTVVAERVQRYGARPAVPPRRPPSGAASFPVRASPGGHRVPLQERQAERRTGVVQEVKEVACHSGADSQLYHRREIRPKCPRSGSAHEGESRPAVARPAVVGVRRGLQ